MEHIVHPFEPVFDRHSRVLILGTMASPKSRENGFFYSHPQNTMWQVLSKLVGCSLPRTVEEKRQLLLQNHIAMWDVLHSCDITGASDSTIKNPVPNDLSPILVEADIAAIYTTGQKATQLYNKLILSRTGREAIYLPSTSPANRGNFPLEKLLSAYSQILDYIAVP